jgi:hypothetical protein
MEKRMKWSLTDPGIFEADAKNRAGKTFTQAVGGWFAFNEGKTVYVNCPTNPVTKTVEHIVNYPHIDYDPYSLIHSNLWNAYVITDQAEQVMDARACQKKDIRNLGYFNYQAKKRALSWHYDTVRHKNIDPRIRLNPDWFLKIYRIPKNWLLPLQAIRINLTGEDIDAWLIWRNPSQFFRVYNDKVMLRPLK